jgi:SsrA-binding protein
MPQHQLINNRKASFDFEIVERIMAGIELEGHEVKSLVGHHGSLEGSFVSIRGLEAFLLNLNLPPYQAANAPKDYDPLRARKLLITKLEIEGLADIEHKKGLTIIPLGLYLVGRKIKVEIAIVKGKKKFDKRQTLRERTSKREIERTLKEQ